MKIILKKSSEELGRSAAAFCAEIINRSIAQKGKARIVVSTGASQFDFFKAFINEKIDWSKVEMFQLDEYIDLPEGHPASFKKYLRERFINHVNLKKVNFVYSDGDIEKNIKDLTEEIRREPIDLGIIGIGENSHIAFNDPPADFDTREAYIVVKLNDACKRQQAGESWFATVDDVPDTAITMSVFQIMQCNSIVSFVPHKVKANAIKLTLENELTNTIPATMLKEHRDLTLFLDENSSSLVDSKILERHIQA